MEIENKLKNNEITLKEKIKERNFITKGIGYHKNIKMWAIYENKKHKRFTHLDDAINYKIKNSEKYEDACIWKEELNIYESELKNAI